MSQTLCPCEGCANYIKCKQEEIACKEYAISNKIGDNPSKKWFEYLNGRSIDHINRGMEKKIKQGISVERVCNWLEDNFDDRIFHELSYPCEKRNEFIRHLRYYFPDEKARYIKQKEKEVC